MKITFRKKINQKRISKITSIRKTVYFHENEAEVDKSFSLRDLTANRNAFRNRTINDIQLFII